MTSLNLKGNIGIEWNTVLFEQEHQINKHDHSFSLYHGEDNWFSTNKYRKLEQYEMISDFLEMQKKIPFALPLLCCLFGFGWVYCVLNLKTVIGFITASTLIDLGLEYTAFCTQTKHSSCIMACYTYTTVKVCCFWYTLLSGRNSYRYFPIDWME